MVTERRSLFVISRLSSLQVRRVRRKQMLRDWLVRLGKALDEVLEAFFVRFDRCAATIESVSYTHLTLPTKA